ILGGRAVGSRWSGHPLRREGRGLLGGLWPSVVLVLIHTEHNCLQYECASCLPPGPLNREASLGLGGVGEPMRCAGCSLRRLLPPPHVGYHGSHVRHEQNPNHSPCQNVHNLTPYASARLSPWWLC